jgi:hypothetical protein
VLCEDSLVSEDIDEIILGFHWLKRNKCQWLFDQGVIVVNGVSIPLKQRPLKSVVTRIYVRETVVVPSNMQVNVPVRMPITSLRTPKCDWVSQAKEIRPDIYAARTLLPHSDRYAAVSFINLSDSDFMVENG